MRTSARNQLPGTLRNVRLGTVIAQVVMAVGDQEIAAAISRDSAKELGLNEGDEVVAIIKSTESIVGKAD